MQEYLNENTLFATVAMYLSEDSNLVLVVEGDDDHLTLKDHCSSDLLLIPGTGGKSQVLKTAELAQNRGLSRVRFLVDKDYDSYSDEPVEELENVFFSEHHDCFVDIVIGDAGLLPRLIDVHTASARRRPGATSRVPEPDKICREALTLASHLAAMRIVDKRLRLSLDFKKFSFGELKVGEFSARSIGEKVLSRSLHLRDRVSEILDEVEAARDEIDQLPLPPLGDHDLFSALARVLRLHKVTVSDRELQRGFILVVKCESLAGTNWFRNIQKWCVAAGKSGFTCRSEVSLAA